MRVPVDIITGFLGSGKTTLLQHVLLHGLDRQRVAVVVNDLADVGVDGRIIAASDLEAVERLVELDSGCICCSIDFRFEYAIQDLVESVQPDLVLIESTGVADPSVLIEKIPQTMLSLDAVITMVDAEHLGRALRESEVAQAQVREADFLVINKTDLVSSAAVEALERRLHGLNPRALPLRATFGRVDTPILFGTSVRAYRERAAAPGGHSHLEEDGIESFSCEVGHALDRDRFERFLTELPANVYRAKGIVLFAGESAPSLFNFTCGRATVQWLPMSGEGEVRSQGVFIGRDVQQHRERIERGFRDCEARA